MPLAAPLHPACRQVRCDIVDGQMQIAHAPGNIIQLTLAQMD
jgi:hypothetical protein